MKLKPLLPSLREKKRYVAFQVVSEENLSQKDVKIAIETTMQNLIGSLGMGKAGVLFLKDWKNNMGILRVNTKYVDHTKASFALIQSINKQTVVVKSVMVSGVLDKIRTSCF